MKTNSLWKIICVLLCVSLLFSCSDTQNDESDSIKYDVTDYIDIQFVCGGVNILDSGESEKNDGVLNYRYYYYSTVYVKAVPKADYTFTNAYVQINISDTYSNGWKIKQSEVTIKLDASGHGEASIFTYTNSNMVLKGVSPDNFIWKWKFVPLKCGGLIEELEPN